MRSLPIKSLYIEEDTLPVNAMSASVTHEDEVPKLSSQLENHKG
jgi:hypothetical protein